MPAARVGRDACCRDVTAVRSILTEHFVLLSPLLPHNKMGSFWCKCGESLAGVFL